MSSNSPSKDPTNEFFKGCLMVIVGVILVVIGLTIFGFFLALIGI